MATTIPVKSEPGKYSPIITATRKQDLVMEPATFRPATLADIPQIQGTEISACQKFGEIGMQAIADDPPMGVDELTGYINEGRAFVALARRPIEDNPAAEANKLHGIDSPNLPTSPTPPAPPDTPEITNNPDVTNEPGTSASQPPVNVTTVEDMAGYILTSDPVDHPSPNSSPDLPVPTFLHIQQVTVHPSFSHRGIGASLISHVAEPARGKRKPARLLSLTTFRDVPWNMPYYERLGFRAVGEAGEGLVPEPLGKILKKERKGKLLGQWPRVAMVKDLD